MIPQLKLVMEYGADKRRETISEVAGIIPDEYDDPCHRDIIVAYHEHQDTHTYHRIDPEMGKYNLSISYTI